MSLTDQEGEREESDLQLALHLSRVEAQKAKRPLTDQEVERVNRDHQLALRLSQQPEAAEWTRSLTAGHITSRAWIDNPEAPPPPARLPRHHPGLGAHQL